MTTAVTPQERLDKMGAWAATVEERLKAVDGLVRGYLAIDDNEFVELAEQMAMLAGRLTNAPAQRFAAMQKLIDAKDQIIRLEARLEFFAANLLLDVYSAIDENGKQKYSNETQRKAALAVLVADDKDCAEIQSKLAELNVDKSRVEAELAHLDDAFKTDRIVYGGSVARLENLTARWTNQQKENGK